MTVETQEQAIQITRQVMEFGKYLEAEARKSPINKAHGEFRLELNGFGSFGCGFRVWGNEIEYDFQEEVQ